MIVFKSLVGMLRITLVFFSVFMGAQAASAQQTNNGGPVKVSTRLVAPFVMKQDGKLQGFSVDLWQALAGQMGKTTAFIEKDTLPNLLSSVETKEADLAISAISITAAREEKFDFSQPMFDSGLQIMVRSDGSDSGFSLAAVRNLLTSGPMPGLLTLLALLILIPAHIVWIAERRHAESIVSENYFPGIFHAIWWATGAAHGQQLDYPKSAVGRTIAALSIFVSVIFIAFFTANVTTALTVQQLKGDINGPEDLPGKKVATVTGSTAAAFLRSSNVAVMDSPNVAGAIALLISKQADAVVFDAPVLLYFAAQEGKGKVQVVGQIFRKEAYGIMFPQDSALRKPVNEALLKLKENGTYDILYRKWFAREDKTN